MSFTLQKLVATLKPDVHRPIAGTAPADACVGGPQWSSSATYGIGNLVTWGGLSYMSLTNANLGNQPPGTAWRLRTSPTPAITITTAIGSVVCGGQVASNLPVARNPANYNCSGTVDPMEPPYYMSSLTMSIDNSPGAVGTLVLNVSIDSFGPYQITFNLNVTNGRTDHFASAMLVFLPAIPITQASVLAWSIVSGSFPAGQTPTSRPSAALTQLNGWALTQTVFGVNGPGAIGPDIALIFATAALTLTGLPLLLQSLALSGGALAQPPAYAPVPAADNVTLHFSNGQNILLNAAAPSGMLSLAGTFPASTTPIQTFTISSTKTGTLAGVDLVTLN